jgi:hypothetical protein
MKPIQLRSLLFSRHNTILIEFREPESVPHSELMSADIVLDCRALLPLPKERLLMPNRIMLPDPLIDSTNYKKQGVNLDAEVITVDAARALDGVNELVQNPTAPTSIAIYQHDILSSGVSDVHEAIGRRFNKPTFESEIEPPLEDDMDVTRINYARNTLLGISGMMDQQLKVNREEIAIVQGAAKSLRTTINGLFFSIQEEVLGPNAKKVEVSISESEAAIKKALSAFSWWKLPFKVDDLGNDVAAALRVHWCRSLEREVWIVSGIEKLAQRKSL